MKILPVVFQAALYTIYPIAAVASDANSNGTSCSYSCNVMTAM